MVNPFIPPSLPPSLNWEALVPRLSAANSALARYDGLLQGLVDPEILLAPLRTREAVLSSQIEGTQATLEDVFEQEAYPTTELTSRQADIQEIINYRAAVQLAVERLDRRPFSLNLIREIHSVLMDSVRGNSRARGEFRRIQNFVGAPGATIEDATYVPPPPQMVMPLLDNVESYVHATEKDAIVQIGLVHAQFELIHPFLDGNGRVGRILVPLLLFVKGVIESPAFYLSAHLEAHRDMYYQRLRGISGNGDYQGWTDFFLGAVATPAESDTVRIRSMLDLYESVKHAVIESTRSQYVVQMLDTLFRWPVFSAPQFARHTGIPAPSAARLLKDLRGAGVVDVVRPGRGRRPAIWSFPALLDLVG
jgi:Fic family protein